MKLTLDADGIARVAELAFALVLESEPRTPERRAAVCLYHSAVVPPAKSVRILRNAIGTYADPIQADALDLLARLAAEIITQTAPDAATSTPQEQPE